MINAAGPSIYDIDMRQIKGNYPIFKKTLANYAGDKRHPNYVLLKRLINKFYWSVFFRIKPNEIVCCLLNGAIAQLITNMQEGRPFTDAAMLYTGGIYEELFKKYSQ